LDNKKNIVLIGMMGAGKSAAGHLLDQKLKDFTYLDIDKEIEKYAKKYISEIFEEDGEARFREIESEIVKKYAGYHNQVIATGGGVVENVENIEILRTNGILFYLNASPKTLYKRVKTTSHRPLLQHDNPQERIKELLKRREKFYKMADFEVNTDKKVLLEIVEEIIEKYESV
jgi:shikimate kinase